MNKFVILAVLAFIAYKFLYKPMGDVSEKKLSGGGGAVGTFIMPTPSYKTPKQPNAVLKPIKERVLSKESLRTFEPTNNMTERDVARYRQTF